MSLTNAVLDLIGGETGGRVSALLGVLVQHEGEEISVADAARASGVSKATAARVVDRLVAGGLVNEARQPRERLIAINVESPLYPAVADLLWVSLGVQGPRGGRLWEQHLVREPTFAIHDYEVQRLVPEELQTPSRRAEAMPNEVYDGPLLPVVRALVLRLEQVRHRVLFEPTLQETYRRWRDERDRDLIHLTLHLGTGIYHAARALRAMSASRDPSQTCLGRWTWVYAVYTVNAEAQMCLHLSNFLGEAVDRARRFQRAQELVADAQRGLQRHADDDDVRGLRARYAEEFAQHTSELEAATAALDGYYWHGGTPPITSVGCAGERLMAVQLRIAAAELSKLVAEMATDPSLERWQHDHAHVLEKHPLIRMFPP